MRWAPATDGSRPIGRVGESEPEAPALQVAQAWPLGPAPPGFARHGHNVCAPPVRSLERAQRAGTVHIVDASVPTGRVDRQATSRAAEPDPGASTRTTRGDR